MRNAGKLTTALRWTMALPPLVPIVIVLVMYGAEAVGHNWNVHGDLLGVIFLLLASLVIGGVVEILALIKALPVLVKNPEERTTGNVLCAGVGVVFLLFCIGVAGIWLV